MVNTDGLKPRFDGTINFGHIFTAVTLMFTIGGLGTYAIRENATTQLAIASMAKDISDFKANIPPRLAAIEAANALNSERITNSANTARSLREDFTATSNEFRRVDTDLYNQVNMAKIAIAGMESRREK